MVNFRARTLRLSIVAAIAVMASAGCARSDPAS